MANLLDALIQQESSGRRGVLGPSTKWGQAMGLTQVLPATGAEMAQKIGVPWRPDLMTAKTDEGAAYQRTIGEAYLNEGLQKTGNVRDALKYYHGGPNRKQWGPKTNAYADKVLALAGNEQQMPMTPQRPPMPAPAAMLEDQPMGIENAGSLANLMQIDPASLQQTPQNVKPGAFGKDGKGWVIAGIIADAIAGGFGGRGGFAPAYAATQENDQRAELYRQQVAERRAERMQPRAEQVGNTIGMLDPSTGAFTPTYQGPAGQPAEADKLAWWNSLSEPDKAAALQMMDATNPIAVSGPQGTMRVPRAMQRPPAEAVNELRSAVSQGDAGAVAEFEAIFGAGSANSYLGQ